MLKLYIYNCIIIGLVFGWIIVYTISNIYLKKRKKAKAKLRILFFVYFYILKVYFNFAIYLFRFSIYNCRY